MARKSRATGTPPGRPPKFKTPEEMEPLINQYFKTCDEGKVVEFFDRKKKTVVEVIEKTPYTMEMLALSLGLDSVSHLWKYIKREGFVQLLTRAKTKIIGSYSENTLLGVYPHSFTPFLLCNMDKNNYKPLNGGNQINIGIGIDLDKKLNQANARVALPPKTVTGSHKSLPAPG